MPGGKEYICDKGWTKKVNINKVNHVNNGVDLAEFEENKKLYNLENSQIANDNAFKVVYMGSIRKVNNLQTLVDAAKELKNRIFIFIFMEMAQKKTCLKMSAESIH